MPAYEYSFFRAEKEAEFGTARLYLNRPEKRNAMNAAFFREFPEVVRELEEDPEVRVVILSGTGKSFCLGLDLGAIGGELNHLLDSGTSEGRERLYAFIKSAQSGVNALARGENIYIASVHRHCIGGGLDIISGCDIRLCSSDARFSLREVKVGIVADMGSLQRLPPIIGQGAARTMAFTGGDVNAQAALRMGLVSEVLDSHEALEKRSLELAREIAANPPGAIRGTKRILNRALERELRDELDYVALWNASFLDNPEFRAILEKAKRGTAG